MRSFDSTHPYTLSWLLAITLLLALAWPLPATAHQASRAPDPELGFHISRGDAEHMAAIRAAGGSFAVIVFSWQDIEPVPNQLYWEKPDAALRAGQFYDVDVIARLDRPPSWALEDSDPTPWDLDAYTNFARRVAQRYGDGLAGIILWNEPNLSLEWNQEPPDPASYVALLGSAYRAIKAVAPNLPVAMAGLASTLGDDQQAISDLDYLEAVYRRGGGEYFDVLATHPYGFGQPPAQAPARDRLNFRRLELQRSIMDAHGDEDKPMWITEMGWRTSAPTPGEAWQVVTPSQQTDYTLQALEYATIHYPWLPRIGLWELNGSKDVYGYALWDGPDKTTPAYDALQQRAADQMLEAGPGREENPDKAQGAIEEAIEILAPDVAIRLGDVGTLHPHWVHLYRGGESFSPAWSGQFYLSPTQAQADYDLLLETMQIDQPTNRVFVNGYQVGRLHPRTRPDITSTWVSQRMPVASEMLQPGVNTLRVTSGLRNPVRQLAAWRWENMMFRHARLVPSQPRQPPRLGPWQPLPSPGGWLEGNRLRAGTAGDPWTLWVTGNRLGHLWTSTPMEDRAELSLETENRPDLTYLDVLATSQGLLTATDDGLLWRASGESAWQPVSGAPTAFAYVVVQHGGRFYAGFEGQGLWRAHHPAGPWYPFALPGHTVMDMVISSSDQAALATASGVYVRPLVSGQPWQRLPGFPSARSDGSVAEGSDRFVQRLFLSHQDEVVARHLDRLWRYDELAGNWVSYGPEALEGELVAAVDCCGPGAVLGTTRAGIWRLDPHGEWQRLDDGLFDGLNVADMLWRLDGLYAATDLGVFRSADTRAWQLVGGPPATISDLELDPSDPKRWLASTPNGVYRSQDGGQTWAAISPPWIVWDMAWGADGRLFLARDDGIAWADNLAAPSITWQASSGLDEVTFFSVNPHPSDPSRLWAGTWGNNVGVSDDQGRSIQALHNGLETLSALDVLWHPTPGQVTIATIEGLYRTDDAGESWFKLPGPLAQQTVHRLMQTNDGTIWAGAANGLWASQDYGANWSRVSDVPQAAILRLGTVAVGGNQWLWAGSEEAGLWMSSDGGSTWHLAGLNGRSIYNVLVHPESPARLLVATDRGIYTGELPKEGMNDRDVAPRYETRARPMKVLT